MAEPVGRPPIYKTPKEMQRIIDLYFLSCRVNKTENTGFLEGLSEADLLIIKNIEDVNPTVSGLAYTLGMSRQALAKYQVKEEFIDTIKKAKIRIENALEQHLYGTAVTGAIFNLKNNFGWIDQTDKKHSGAVGMVDLSDKTDEELNAIINGKA